MGKLRGLRQQQQPRCLDRVAGDADDPRLLALLLALRVPIYHAGDAPVGAVLDARRHALDAQIEITGGLGARDLGVQGAPFRARLAALHAKALLDAEAAAVRRRVIDGHVAGVDPLVAELLRGGVHDFEVVRGGQARIAVAARDDQAALGELVVALQLLVGDRPVDERGAGDVAVGAAGSYLPGPDPGSRAGPVHRRTADGLAIHDGQRGEVLSARPRCRTACGDRAR